MDAALGADTADTAAAGTVDATTIRRFLHAQVAAWNAGDKKAFFDAYRAVSPHGLSIEYVGRGPATDGWPVLEAMWAQQSAKIEIEEVMAIVNGDNDAACHNRNKLRGSAIAIETIELYRFDAGRLSVRYYVRQP